MKLKNSHILLIVYYLFLFVLETPLILNVGIPSAIVRVGYILSVVIPILAFDKTYLPIVIIASYSLSKFGTAVTLMPTDVWYYVPVFILLALPFKGIKDSDRKTLIPIIVLCLGVLWVDLISSQKVHDIFWCFLILITLFYYSFRKINNETYFLIFTHSFIVISIVLSLELLLAGDQYIEGYGYTDLDRVLWADPNYLGGVIGMGGMAAALLLFRNNTSSFKIYLTIALLIVITALVRNASRGALLAVICGVSILFMGGKLKFWKKLIILTVAAGFVYILYTSNYFELLEYRLENDTGGGSGRTGIWLNKWNAYINNSSILQMLFGMGFDNGYKAGFSYNRAFHNDFLAFLVDYGAVGFIAFVCMFFYPLKGVLFKNRDILGCVVFLFVNCMTLEPFTLGVLLYYVFWFYTCYQAMSYRNSHSSSGSIVI